MRSTAGKAYLVAKGLIKEEVAAPLPPIEYPPIKNIQPIFSDPKKWGKSKKYWWTRTEDGRLVKAWQKKWGWSLFVPRSKLGGTRLPWSELVNRLTQVGLNPPQ